MPDEKNRERLYSRYLATQAAPELTADSGETVPADFSGYAYGHYFSSLLPADRSSRILDLGCGRGEFIAFLNHEGYRDAQGVEFSADQADYAQRRGIPVVRCDLRQFLGSGAGPWDCIVALDVMEHFSAGEVVDLISAIHGELAPGGRFIMRSPNAGSPFFGSLRYGDLTHEIAFTRMSVSQLFRNAGFARFGLCDAGPRPHGLKSTIRFVIWRCLSFLFRIFTLIEMGYSETVFSRNLIAWAEKDGVD